jgi:zeaxanthin glucosyltransferase
LILLKTIYPIHTHLLLGMQRIIIDILPVKGHFKGSLKIAKLIEEAGFEVLYLDVEPLKTEINKYGFQTFSSGIFMYPVLLNPRKFKLKVLIASLFIVIKNDGIKKAIKDFHNFKNFISELSPDLVLLDEQNMLKAIYYELCGIPVISIETKPDPCKFENAPPFTSFFVPSGTLISKWICKLLWFRKVTLNRYRLKKLQLNCLWTDHYSITSKIAGKHCIDLKKRTDLERAFAIGIKGIPRLILSPVAFDFPQKGKEDTYRIGPLIDINREGEISHPRYSALGENITKFKDSGKGFVVYCSLGTITMQFKKRVNRFFFKLLMVARQNPDDLFILSTGKEFEICEIFPVPDNLYVYQYVPQIDLLQKSDIMITHGGMNSITECVFCQVPMLIYPLSQEWDQPGNGARAVYHRIGLMGRINRDSPKKTSQKLTRLKSDYSFYKHNILEMKSKFEVKNNSDEAIRIIEMTLNKQTEIIQAEYEMNIQN